MLEAITCLKGTSALLEDAEPWIWPLVERHLRRMLDAFVNGVLPVLAKSHASSPRVLHLAAALQAVLMGRAGSAAALPHSLWEAGHAFKAASAADAPEASDAGDGADAGECDQRRGSRCPSALPPAEPTAGPVGEGHEGRLRLVSSTPRDGDAFQELEVGNSSTEISGGGDSRAGAGAAATAASGAEEPAAEAASRQHESDTPGAAVLLQEPCAGAGGSTLVVEASQSSLPSLEALSLASPDSQYPSQGLDPSRSRWIVKRLSMRCRGVSSDGGIGSGGGDVHTHPASPEVSAGGAEPAESVLPLPPALERIMVQAIGSQPGSPSVARLVEHFERHPPGSGAGASEFGAPDDTWHDANSVQLSSRDSFDSSRNAATSAQSPALPGPSEGLLAEAHSVLAAVDGEPAPAVEIEEVLLTVMGQQQQQQPPPQPPQQQQQQQQQQWQQWQQQEQLQQEPQEQAREIQGTAACEEALPLDDHIDDSLLQPMQLPWLDSTPEQLQLADETVPASLLGLVAPNVGSELLQPMQLPWQTAGGGQQLPQRAVEPCAGEADPTVAEAPVPSSDTSAAPSLFRRLGMHLHKRQHAAGVQHERTPLQAAAAPSAAVPRGTTADGEEPADQPAVGEVVEGAEAAAALLVEVLAAERAVAVYSASSACDAEAQADASLPVLADSQAAASRATQLLSPISPSPAPAGWSRQGASLARLFGLGGRRGAVAPANAAVTAALPASATHQLPARQAADGLELGEEQPAAPGATWSAGEDRWADSVLGTPPRADAAESPGPPVPLASPAHGATPVESPAASAATREARASPTAAPAMGAVSRLRRLGETLRIKGGGGGGEAAVLPPPPPLEPPTPLNALPCGAALSAAVLLLEQLVLELQADRKWRLVQQVAGRTQADAVAPGLRDAREVLGALQLLRVGPLGAAAAHASDLAALWALSPARGSDAGGSGGSGSGIGSGEAQPGGVQPGTERAAPVSLPETLCADGTAGLTTSRLPAETPLAALHVLADAAGSAVVQESPGLAVMIGRQSARLVERFLSVVSAACYDHHKRLAVRQLLSSEGLRTACLHGPLVSVAPLGFDALLRGLVLALPGRRSKQGGDDQSARPWIVDVTASLASAFAAALTNDASSIVDAFW
jgi:hypothetical protein